MRTIALSCGVALLALLAACDPGPLPDQTKLPPNVRLTASSGAASVTVDQNAGATLTLPDVDTPIEVAANGFSSLVGLARIEVRFDLLVGCWVSGTRQVAVKVPFAPVVKTWDPSAPLVLHGFVEHSLEQRGHCQRLGVGGRDAGLSGDIRMTATSRSGLSTTSRSVIVHNDA